MSARSALKLFLDWNFSVYVVSLLAMGVIGIVEDGGEILLTAFVMALSAPIIIVPLGGMVVLLRFLLEPLLKRRAKGTHIKWLIVIGALIGSAPMLLMGDLSSEDIVIAIVTGVAGGTGGFVAGSDTPRSFADGRWWTYVLVGSLTAVVLALPLLWSVS